MQTKVVTRGGLSLCNLLTVAFVVLKLCKVIAWSWWWVLSPLWAPWAIVFATMGLLGTLAVLIKVIARIVAKKEV